MFTELLAAKRKYYGEENFYPTAVKMTDDMWSQLKMEGKALNMNSSNGFNVKEQDGCVGSANGLRVYIDNDISEFMFGYHYKDGFHKKAF